MLDEKDLSILSELMDNARKPVKAISGVLGIPRATIHERMRKMERGGVIRRYTVVPDYSKLGEPVTAFILVSFLPNPEVSQRDLAKKIARLERIYEVHLISGEWDILLKVRGRSMEEIGELVIDKLRMMRGVEKTLTCACFTTIME